MRRFGRDLIGYILSAPIGWAFFEFIKETWPQLQERTWILLIVGAATVALVLVLITGIVRAAFKIHSLLLRVRVGSHVGISRVFRVAKFSDANRKVDKRELADAGRAMADLVKNEDSVRLLLASGWYHLGCDREPGGLYEALRTRAKPPQSLQILLYDAGIATERAKATGLEHPNYVEGQKAVIWTLAQLSRSRSVPVEVRLYRDAPIWQMLITDAELWLLCAVGMGSATSPVYCFRRDADYGLSHGLVAVWQRRWDTAEPVELAKAVEPNWDLVKDVTAVRKNGAAAA